LASRSSTAGSSASDWPAVVVAVGILVLLGAILVTATTRWTEVELKDLLGSLGPILALVTGAFVTYFFTRQATASATTAAQAATDMASKTSEAAQVQLTSQTARARALHNALTTAMAIADNATAEKMRQDPTIRAVLAPDDT
jgi:di/tricarboxylate transporter